MSEAGLEPETDDAWQARADAYEAKQAWAFEEAERREEAAEIARRKRMLGDNLRPMDVESFLRLDLPKRDCLLEPVFPERGPAMLYAPRGVGKTWAALAFGEHDSRGVSRSTYQQASSRPLQLRTSALITESHPAELMGAAV